VPTESVKRDVCAQLPVPDEKVTVIPEAARKCFRPESPVKAKPTLERLGIDNDFILYVGAIEPRKNLLTLVKAFREVYEKTDLRPQLVIAGPTAWLADELFDLISRSSIKERLLLTGYLGDEALRALYSTCTVMCYPALYEGAGLPPLEAMACGAPVITTSTGAISEMVGDAALLFSPTDYHALAANIVELFIDPQLRSALISKGLKRVENFSWDKAAAMTYKLYRDTLNANED
jgi:glycosyltransferase involved in cell wall biosynthesis